MLRVPACDSCPYLNADRCEGAITRGSMEQESGAGLIGCHSVERIKQFYDYLHNVKPIAPRPSRQFLTSLPSFIPVLESGMPHGLKLDTNRLYGVYLRSVIDSYGNFKYKNGDTLRNGLRLPSTGRLALFVTATDTLIERAWAYSEDRDLWERLVGFNFEFITSATFSVYEDEPRSDQIYNQDRNFRTHELFCDLGVPCIPFLFFNPSSNLDYRNVITWLKRRQDVVKVAVLAQSYKHPPAFQRMLTQVRSIATDAERALQFVFVGASTLDKVRLVLSEYRDAVFVTAQPVSKARVGELVGPALEPKRIADTSKAELILASIDSFDRTIDAERARYRPRDVPYQDMLPFQFQVLATIS